MSGLSSRELRAVAELDLLFVLNLQCSLELHGCGALGGVPTIDMRVDYHAVALPGDLTIKGKVVRMGSQFSVSEARIFDQQGKLLASGRGTYLTAPPPPPKAS